METISLLSNPFIFRSSIIIPAGTAYTTADPKKTGPQVVKRQITNRVENMTKPFAQHFPNEIYVDESSIDVGTFTGWYKTIIVTEELIKANGLTPVYVDVKIRPLPEGLA